ncbi:hypothetical protein [Amphritea sp.]|uniref:hypothetical protein n=1 Tax=Amphritea sp. TaxID=1872502 RepID=UPI0025BD76C5|nr:hypothetical protein [Amphritea sp.]
MMFPRIDKIFNRLAKFWCRLSESAVVPVRLVFIDVGFNSYQLSSMLIDKGLINVVAFIDEEPWSHLNEMNGGKLHYPSELLAMVDRYDVKVVVKFKEQGWKPSLEALSALSKRQVSYLLLNKEMSLAQQLDAVSQEL